VAFSSKKYYHREDFPSVPLMSDSLHCLQLDNGLRFLLIPNPSNDIVAGRIFVRAGSVFDPPPLAGISYLMTAVLTKGTAQRSAMEIATQVESIGAGLSAEAHNDHVEISWKSVASDFPMMLKLVAEILRTPNFPAAQVELEKKVVLQGIRSQAERPLSLAFQRLRSAMYGEHPYGRFLMGTPETVERIDSEALSSQHAAYYRPERTVVSIAGRINPEIAEKLVKESFGDWQPPLVPTMEMPRSPISGLPQRQFLAKSGQQSIVMLGQPAVAVTDPDYFVLRTINSYLSSGLSSRLFVELREKRGLAYEVSSIFSTKAEQAIFAVYIGTANEKVSMAIDGLRAELARLCLARWTGEELSNTQSKLLGKYALSKQTNAQLAYLYGWYESLGLGWDFDRRLVTEIEKITPQRVEEVANKYFDHPPYISIVGAAEFMN
jgi:zinc protease